MEITQAQAKTMIRNAYQPDECESCELQGGTCWECADDALEGCVIVIVL